MFKKLYKLCEGIIYVSADHKFAIVKHNTKDEQQRFADILKYNGFKGYDYYCDGEDLRSIVWFEDFKRYLLALRIYAKVKLY